MLENRVPTTQSGFLSLELKQRLNTLVARGLSLVGRKVPGRLLTFQMVYKN